MRIARWVGAAALGFGVLAAVGLATPASASATHRDVRPSTVCDTPAPPPDPYYPNRHWAQCWVNNMAECVATGDAYYAGHYNCIEDLVPNQYYREYLYVD